ncbi:unnamed protein product [Mycena citricolor]|uniref:Cytochrome P450 n=1 Tax=Mycena citricolor TaxID=2018698 RepID=A0AAD2H4Q7_9AGAR|nr:unnamed protein product [Mycena citricolor]
MSDYTFIVTAGAFFCFAVYKIVVHSRRVKLRGPPSPSFVFGHTQLVAAAQSPAELYSKWSQEYGSIFQIRGPFGSCRLIACDPRAIAHIYALDSWKYCHSPLALKQLTSLTGPMSLIETLGAEHNLQRKIFSPLFGPAALQSYTGWINDCGHKISSAWQSELQSSSEQEIMVDLSTCINNFTFDLIGLIAFAHEFKSLDGEPSPVSSALSALGHAKPSPAAMKILLAAQAFPSLLKLPLPRSILVNNLSDAMDAVVEGMVQKSGTDGPNKSVLGVLLTSGQFSPAQIQVHAKSFLLAGFATTSSSIKWALVELSMHPEKQDRLRTELSVFRDQDPSYDALATGFAYLDAVLRETLRLHPVLSDSTRVALEDDVIPLSRPVQTASGAYVDKLPIAKGTHITTSFFFTSLSKSVWGADASEFKPERWLDDSIPASAKEFPGYSHTMAFLDGPRTCLGKGLALLELRMLLSLLVSRYSFSPKHGPQTKFERAFYLGPHPKVAGEPGAELPIRVKPVV